MYVYVCGHACHSMCMDVGGQFVGTDPLLQQCEFPGIKLRLSGWQPASLPAEPSYQLLSEYFITTGKETQAGLKLMVILCLCFSSARISMYHYSWLHLTLYVFTYLHYYLFCVCMYMCTFVSWCTCGGQRKLVGVGSLLHYVGSGHQIQVVRLSDRCFYLLSHFANLFLKSI